MKKKKSITLATLHQHRGNKKQFISQCFFPLTLFCIFLFSPQPSNQSLAFQHSTHTHTHTYTIHSFRAVHNSLTCFDKKCTLSHMPEAMVTQKSQVSKDHLRFLWAFSSSFFSLWEPGPQKGKKEMSRAPLPSALKKKKPNPPLDAPSLPPASCYLALRKVTFFSWPPSPWRSSSSLQEVGHWLISLPRQCTRKKKRLVSILLKLSFTRKPIKWSTLYHSSTYLTSVL